jgi:hypothetical protein
MAGFVGETGLNKSGMVTRYWPLDAGFAVR